MRHNKKGSHLGRTTSHRNALIRNLVAQVLEHKEIRTTTVKAKEMRKYVDRMITYGKKGTLHHRRLAFKFLQNKKVVDELFEQIAPTFADRNGGYSRIIKLGNRLGDNAPVSIFQLVGFNENEAPKVKKPRAKKQTKETVNQNPKKAADKNDPIVDGSVQTTDQITE
jgi:large subunit ribosomal protein L17